MISISYMSLEFLAFSFSNMTLEFANLGKSDKLHVIMCHVKRDKVSIQIIGKAIMITISIYFMYL